jgi:hypothetical protein
LETQLAELLETGFRNTRFQKAAEKHKRNEKKQKAIAEYQYIAELCNGDLERSGMGSCGIQSPQCQELSAVAVAAPLTTLKCSEVQNVDLANRVRGNHYLRHFDHRSVLHGDILTIVLT